LPQAAQERHQVANAQSAHFCVTATAPHQCEIHHHIAAIEILDEETTSLSDRKLSAKKGSTSMYAKEISPLDTIRGGSIFLFISSSIKQQIQFLLNAMS